MAQLSSIISNPSFAVRKEILPAVLALLLGVFFIGGIGFAGSEVIHNAAHDGRHAFAFPCH